MDMIEKAPEIYQELQQQLQLQQASSRGGGEVRHVLSPTSGPPLTSHASQAGPSGSRSDGAKDNKSGISDTWYDIGGWVVLAGIVAYLAIAQSKAPMPPTPMA